MGKILVVMMCFIWGALSGREGVGLDISCEGNGYVLAIEELESINVREISAIYNANSIKVTIEVKYTVDSTPPTSFYYTSIKNGIKYAGTLSIVAIRSQKDAKYATYRGYLDPME